MNITLLHLLAKNWWVLLVRGLAGIIFGLLAFAWPGLTLVTLIYLFGIFVGAEGLLALAAALRGGTVAPRWWLVIAGLAGLAAAAVTFMAPGITALFLLYVIGIWAIARGTFEIIGAIQLRRHIANEWLLIFSGGLSVIFGACVVLMPGAGVISLIWVVGAYSLMAGLLCVGLAFRLKKHHHPHPISQPASGTT